jgi:hypothetical protein
VNRKYITAARQGQSDGQAAPTARTR